MDHAIHFRDSRAAGEIVPQADAGGARGLERRCATRSRSFLGSATAAQIQDVVYEIGVVAAGPDLSGKGKTKDGKPGVSLEWFNMLYQVLLGQEEGTALRLLRRRLWHREHGRHDRWRAGASLAGLTDSPTGYARSRPLRKRAACDPYARDRASAARPPSPICRFNSLASTSSAPSSPPPGRPCAGSPPGEINDDVAVAIERLHGIAGDFERIGMLVVHGRGTEPRPSRSPTGKPPSSK